MSSTDVLAAGESSVPPVRVRTITAGVELPTLELASVEKAIQFLARAKKAFVDAGYEVQTLRVAINPVIAGLDTDSRNAALRKLEKIDQLVTSHGVIFNVGPVLIRDESVDRLIDWAEALVTTTRSISFSTVIASPEHGVHPKAAGISAKLMVALSRALPDGMANFRFAAAANIAAGTPFFPVAWHRGAESFALGMEAASVVERGFNSSRPSGRSTSDHLRLMLDETFVPVETIARRLAASEGRPYLGIDTSPAPAKDRSIAAAIEALTRTPFGSHGTLEACSMITAALKSVSVRTCGYCGLMLPVLEDPLLAQRAGEHHYTIRDLLLFSSVCGTGLDVVPIPGDTSAETIASLLRDVAALSSRLQKPLSARLFLVPGKQVGEIARFDDPFLTDSVVMAID